MPHWLSLCRGLGRGAFACSMGEGVCLWLAPRLGRANPTSHTVVAGASCVLTVPLAEESWSDWLDAGWSAVTRIGSSVPDDPVDAAEPVAVDGDDVEVVPLIGKRGLEV